jgi:hypothetical protein
VRTPRDQRRRFSRLFQVALQVLAEQSQPIVLQGLLDETARRFPLSDYEQSRTGSGHIRGWLNLR